MSKIFQRLKNRQAWLYVAVTILTLTYVMSWTRACSSTDKRESLKTALVNPKNKDKITKIRLSHVMAESQVAGAATAGTVESGEKGATVDRQGIILSTKEKSLFLEKKSDYWILYENDGGRPLNFIPADSQKVQNFLEDLTIIRNLSKISDEFNPKDSSYGLNDEKSFKITYYFDDSSYDLIFGDHDFSGVTRYLMTGNSLKVYETDNSLDKYTSTSIQNWSEPFIISQNILGKIKAEDVQSLKVEAFAERAATQSSSKKIRKAFDSKLLDLRHGGLASDKSLEMSSSTNPELSLELELGNKNKVSMAFYDCDKLGTTESDYIVKVTYITDGGAGVAQGGSGSVDAVSGQVKADSENAGSARPTKETSTAVYEKVSAWTYNKIREITL